MIRAWMKRELIWIAAAVVLIVVLTAGLLQFTSGGRAVS